MEYFKTFLDSEVHLPYVLSSYFVVFVILIIISVSSLKRLKKLENEINYLLKDEKKK